MIVTDETGHKSLNRRLAGYVDYHGADCYKTAALLVRAGDSYGQSGLPADLRRFVQRFDRYFLYQYERT